MRLARKLILSMVIGLALVLSANSYYRVRRELAAFDQDMAQDHQVLAQVLRESVTAVWTNAGREAAIALIDKVRSPSDMLHVLWVEGERMDARTAAEDALVTRVPILVDGALKGTIEIRESRHFARNYARHTMIRSLILTVVAVLGGGFIATVIGIRYVGKPIDKLVEKTRRIAAGDMASPLEIRQHDEIGELGTEINAMCLRLEETRHALNAEIAERLRTQEQLRHADRLATVGKLASGIAHELGTPLGVALMRANMIATNQNAGRETRDAGRIIGEQIDRITHIVRQLLDFARGRGTVPPGPLKRQNPTDLVALANHVVSMLQPLAVKRNLVIDIVRGDNTPEPPTNAQQIEQVLVNLVVNAIHASKPARKVTISIASDDARPPADVTPPMLAEDGEPHYAVISVKDEGIGIAPEILPRIFEPFFTTKNVGEGTGLGLSGAYGIVREHGGWIEVESERDKGSCFSVYLPLSFAELI